MVNEAARCLEEKVVATAADADYGMMLGTGFRAIPRRPLRFADHYGLKKLVAEMDGLHSAAGEKFAPVRFASASRPEWNYILMVIRDAFSQTSPRRNMNSPLEAPEKQIAEETSAKPAPRRP